ncbi:Sec-independent protein translocase subunit TatA [Kitasatospora sp. NPDC059646]|uniref:Sec-independent protein translocase protein TatA n=1 Tax=Kitasatospora cheerisanensis KCTC 2395 TaxID=1348663 RepID=A0A066YT64_9ACTN|nr:Sec-independent protein translocase subunit TatA [Kitasatospora cheerisanensis]KDN84718.1 putative sec-independent protein translocase protein TatA/E-like protein [Kitasatospora cheerisanensis KCTC 2395]
MFRNGLEPWHIAIMVVVLVLLFGSKKLPEMARGLGKSMRILKAETKALREDDAPAEAQNGTAASQAEQPRQAVEPTVVTKATETPKSTTA